MCCPSSSGADSSDVTSLISDSIADSKSIVWYILEVREDGLLLKTKRGDVADHCPYDGIVNMTYSPKTKIICLWRRVNGLTQLKKYHTKKVISFYNMVHSQLR